MNPVSSATVDFLIPEVLVAVTAIWIFVVGAFYGGKSGWSWVAILGLLLAGGHLLFGNLPAAGEYGPVTFDKFGHVLRTTAVIVGILFVLMTNQGGKRGASSELVGAMLLVIAGVMLVSCANELVILFVGLELISIPTYLLLYLGRGASNSSAAGDNAELGSQEATSKYFFLSVLSSAILLYGFSFLYGLTGELRLSEIAESLAASELGGPLPVLALLLIVAGLGFKIAAVPFHFYAPDVYQGTTNLNAGLLSVVPKIAGVVVLVRLVAAVLPPDLAQFGWQLCLVLSIITMTLGNVAALWQNNIRRLLAYSSIAHAGYMLIGLCVFLAARSAQGETSPVEFVDGLSSMLLYLAVYVVATLGTFAALVHLSRVDESVDRVEQLTGLGKTRPLIAVALAVFMFSLAGIPPLAGFWGKMGLFFSALGVNGSTDLTIAGIPMRTALIALAVVGALNAAIAAAYYLRIVATMYFRSAAGSSSALSPASSLSTPGAAFVVGVCMLLAVVLGCYPASLEHLTRGAATKAVEEPLEQSTAATDATADLAEAVTRAETVATESR